MTKKVVLILEYGNGGYSCYNDDPIGKYAVIDGDGATAEEAKADFMRNADRLLPKTRILTRIWSLPTSMIYKPSSRSSPSSMLLT